MRTIDKASLLHKARTLTASGDGGQAAAKRRAFDLAHRAFRCLELAAETASRDRWSMMVGPKGPVPRDPERKFAADIAAAAMTYPVRGEAKVYAALLGAVDLAHSLSERLYREWVETQRTSGPVPPPERGVNRTGAPLAPGCSRRESCGNSDEEDAP